MEPAMHILNRLKTLYQRYSRIDPFFTASAKEQQQFLNSLPSPKDDIERSYLQYRCQSYLMRRSFLFLINLASMPLLLYSLQLRCREIISAPFQKKRAVLIFSGSNSIVPQSLQREYNIVHVKDFEEHLLLNREDKVYLRALQKRYPFSFYFRFKCMVKIAMYRYVISSYGPEAIVCSEEYSFTSSLLTDYCYKNRVKHINIAHGEKLFFIRDSFFHFDHCFVWDAHYIKLFTCLRAPQEQFILEIPSAFFLSSHTTAFESVDYTYYLGGESTEQIMVILEKMAILRDRGHRVALRPHPRYFKNSEFLYRDGHGFLIERPADIPIEDSLLRTGCAVALYSTVLYQASLNKIPIAIDDISDPERFQRLQEMQFIILEREYSLLSDLLLLEKKEKGSPGKSYGQV